MSDPTTAATPNADGNDYEEHQEDEEVQEEEVNEVQEWDEGGPSHCGYAETVHETIMAVGKGVHTVVGDPSPVVEQGIIKSVGNWFQEASYAVRDFVRGNKEVEDDASQTFNDMKDGAMSAIYGEQPNEPSHPNENQLPTPH